MSKYKGWTNYETWCVYTWLTNDEHTYNESLELAKQAFLYAEQNPNKYLTNEENARYVLVDSLKDKIINEIPEIEASFYLDFILASIRVVNFHEITRHLINSVLEESRVE